MCRHRVNAVLDCVDTMPPHFENGEKCDGSKIWASVHTMPEQFENSRKFDCKISLQDLDAKDRYLHPKNRPVSFQKRLEMFCFIIFKCSLEPVSKMCRSDFRFPNLQFSESAGKNVPCSWPCWWPCSCEWEAYPSNFSSFQNVLASCQRSFSYFHGLMNGPKKIPLCFYCQLLVLACRVKA